MTRQGNAQQDAATRALDQLARRAEVANQIQDLVRTAGSMWFQEREQGCNQVAAYINGIATLLGDMRLQWWPQLLLSHGEPNKLPDALWLGWLWLTIINKWAKGFSTTQAGVPQFM